MAFFTIFPQRLLSSVLDVVSETMVIGDRLELLIMTQPAEFLFRIVEMDLQGHGSRLIYLNTYPLVLDHVYKCGSNKLRDLRVHGVNMVPVRCQAI
jgi:hypothetical protein